MPSDHRLLVFSNAAPGKDEEFNAWYEQHLGDILEVPGFEAAQRFALSEDQFPPEAIPPCPHRYLTIYEVSVSPAQAIPPLLDPAMATVPDVFDRASERAFWFTAAGPLQGPAVSDPEHKLVVLSNPAEPSLDAELNAWYDAHLHEVIGLGAGVVNAQRFRLSDDQFPPEAVPPSEHRYLAMYDTETVPKHTCDTLAAAMVDFEHPRTLDLPTLRDWMFSALGARRLASPTAVIHGYDH